VSSLAFRRLAVKTLDIKRLAPIGADGKREAASLRVSGVKCLPLDPVSEEIRQEIELSKPFQAKQTFIDSDVDVREKDIVVVDGVDYVVRAVGEWRWDNATDTTRIIVEDARIA
jgi:hypothetical protein